MSMYPRTNYEMTQADFDKLIKAMQPVPMIMLHIGGSRSQQEHANNAWEVLGEKMGFDYMTVQPSNKGERFFTAVPSETEMQREDRLQREKEEKRKASLAEVQAKIVALQVERDRLLEGHP